VKIGVLRVYFHLHGCRSLKEKRMVVRSLKDRLLGKFNVSVAEIGSNDKWQLGEIGVVTIGNDHQYVDSVMQKVRNFIEINPSLRVIEADVEII
jgi:uncharacterized protein YlxP (DUF503 family)